MITRTLTLELSESEERSVSSTEPSRDFNHAVAFAVKEIDRLQERLKFRYPELKVEFRRI